jgi:hypothetical protein
VCRFNILNSRPNMSKLSKLFSDARTALGFGKNTKVISNEVKSVWRNNMWVMTPEGPGIIFALGVPCVVHMVDTTDGTTVKSTVFDPSQLRQALYMEIPEIRRGPKEKANRLGYV